MFGYKEVTIIKVTMIKNETNKKQLLKKGVTSWKTNLISEKWAALKQLSSLSVYAPLGRKDEVQHLRDKICSYSIYEELRGKRKLCLLLECQTLVC